MYPRFWGKYAQNWHNSENVRDFKNSNKFSSFTASQLSDTVPVFPTLPLILCSKWSGAGALLYFIFMLLNTMKSVFVITGQFSLL